jgi:hypothetical protein
MMKHLESVMAQLHTRGGCINLTGALSLLASAAVLKRCRLLVANDSGLMHVAEAVGAPLLAIFGSTTRELGFFPQLAGARVVENHGLPCRAAATLAINAARLVTFVVCAIFIRRDCSSGKRIARRREFPRGWSLKQRLHHSHFVLY